MEAKKILSANLLDLVFDERNKAYGAYELRVTYEQRIKKSLFITGSIALLILGGTVWANSEKKVLSAKFEIDEQYLQTIKEEIPIPPPEQEPPPPVEQPRTVVQLPPTFADIVETIPPSQDAINNAEIGAVNIDGPTGEVPTEITPPGDGTGIIEVKKQDEPTGPWEKVEIEAKFAGNWIKFLERNLNGSIPVDNNAPYGRHTVKIKFVVDIDGSVSNIQPITNLGFGMEDEAVRVLKKADKWEPAIQNGIPVKAYRIQLITFEVLEDQ